LEKKLRCKPLFYRLQRMRAPDDGPCEVIAFPKARVGP
jgi:hypothetical protein